VYKRRTHIKAVYHTINTNIHCAVTWS